MLTKEQRDIKRYKRKEELEERKLAQKLEREAKRAKLAAEIETPTVKVKFSARRKEALDVYEERMMLKELGL